MNRPQRLRDVDRMVMMTAMFEVGIIPIEQASHDMRKPLQQLPPDEARHARRKFRKQWRKAMRAELTSRSTRTHETLQSLLGVGSQVPTRAQRLARKQLVFDTMWKAMEPVIRAFDNPQATCLHGGPEEPLTQA